MDLIERTPTSRKLARVVVIGSGLSGLAAAHRIHELAASSRQPIEVVVLEAKNRIGGVIWTERVNGFTLEGGPDSFITNKPWGIDLCTRLGLTDQLMETDSSHRRSFVVRKGQLAPVPEGFVLMVPHRILPILTTPVLSWGGKLRVLMDLVIPRRDEDTEESLAAFVRRRLGREALERLVQPLVGGIYTGHTPPVPGHGAGSRQPDSRCLAAAIARSGGSPACASRVGCSLWDVRLAGRWNGRAATDSRRRAAAGNRSNSLSRAPVEPQRCGLSLDGRAA